MEISRRRLSWIQTKLGSRWMPYFTVALALILALPALGAGWYLDDFIQRYFLDSRYIEGREAVSLDIFRFIEGDPEQTKEWMDVGVCPWWTSSNLKVGFWRPLTVLTHWIDYQLWPSSAVLMHLQSILWFGALVLVVGLYYRRIMGIVWVAGLAALLFAIDDAHGTAIGWVANRNTLIATLLGVISLVAHDRWRRDGWRVGAFLAPLVFLASLLAKESAIATGAYLLSYAVFVDRDSRTNRLLSLIPYTVIALTWRVVWAQLGYGAAGTDFYADPLVEPVRYIGLLFIRSPILLFGQWTGIPSESFMFLKNEAMWIMLCMAVVVVVILATLLMPCLRRDRVARFWGLGMLLSLLPAAATVSSDRLLFFVGLGAMGLLARFYYMLTSGVSTQPRGGVWLAWARTALVLMTLIHLVVPLVALPVRARFPLGSEDLLNRQLIRNEFDPSVEHQDVIIPNVPNSWIASYYWIMRQTSCQPVPRRLRILSSGLSAVNIHRLDERTLVLKPDEGFLAEPLDRLARSSAAPMVVGETVELTDVTAEVLALTDDGRPSEVRFQFAVPLEDPSLLWLQYEDGEYVPFRLPAIGEQVRLPAIPPLLSMLE